MNERRKPLWIVLYLVAFVMLLLGPGAAAQPINLIENGSFEIYAKAPSAWNGGGMVDMNLDIGNPDIEGWTVINGAIDYIGSYMQAAEGERSLDLCGAPGSGGVSQTFPTTVGTAYVVQFHMSGNPMTGWSGEDQPNKTLAVQAAGQRADFSYDVGAAQNSYQNMKWKPCTFSFVADSDSTTLEIISTMDPLNIGPMGDNVAVLPLWSPAGSYAGTNNHGEELLVTITPLGQDNMRFAIVRDALNQNPGYKGRPVSRGEMIRVRANEYAMTVVAHVTDADLNLQWRAVVSGSIVQTGPDTLATDLALALFTLDQDPFAEGTVPMMCLPGTMDVCQRIPIMAPCVPTPMP